LYLSENIAIIFGTKDDLELHLVV